MGNRNRNSVFLTPTDPVEISAPISQMKNKKSCGHDGVSSSLLKSIIEELSVPLSMLINKSLGGGYVPDKLKTAKVIPILKAKDKQQFEIYRPISLLPDVSKVLEKVIFKHIFHFYRTQ